MPVGCPSGFDMLEDTREIGARPGSMGRSLDMPGLFDPLVTKDLFNSQSFSYTSYAGPWLAGHGHNQRCCGWPPLGSCFNCFNEVPWKLEGFMAHSCEWRERERDVCFSFELPRGWVISGSEKEFLWPLYFHDLLGLKIATSIAICFNGLSCFIICILHILHTHTHIYIYI